MEADDEPQLFVSFSSLDKAWGDWISWTLDREGFSVVYQPWDFQPGTNFVLKMNEAAGRSRTIALLSENYLSSSFTQPEWAAAFAQDPTGLKRNLVPIRISECRLEGTLLGQIVYVDLVGVHKEEEAVDLLLAGIRGARPAEVPDFPARSLRGRVATENDTRTGARPLFPGTVADPDTRASATRNGLDCLPPPGLRVPFSPTYVPPTFRGVQVHAESPFVLDFILDSGDAMLEPEDLKEVSTRLTKYFLTALTVPDAHLWVNLSPHEMDQVIPDDLAETQLGVDLLVQDYILKQVTATATFPEQKTGNEYWQSIYNSLGAHADNKTDTFNKVWITPKNARIIERGPFAIVESSELKVQTEEDYLSTQIGRQSGAAADPHRAKVADEVFKQQVLPMIESDVNKGGNFAVLRQIFASLILSVWYKQTLRDSIVGELFIDKSKTSGMAGASAATPDEIFKQYVESFERGVFNYIREEVDLVNNEVVARKYFSGGFSGADIGGAASNVASDRLVLRSKSNSGYGRLYWVRMNLSTDGSRPTDDSNSEIDAVGGINLSIENEDFDYSVEQNGGSFRFHLPKETVNQLYDGGMAGLRPIVAFSRLITLDRLEISRSTDLSALFKPRGHDDRDTELRSENRRGILGMIRRIRARFLTSRRKK